MLLSLAALLALALVGANLMYASLPLHGAALDGAAGDLLYIAAFSGFADEWRLYQGRQSAAVVDERLELAVGAPQRASWTTARHTFDDFDFSVSATATAGPIDNAFGVVFHLQDRERATCDLPAVILCGVEDWLPLAGAALRQIWAAPEGARYFAFLISSDGYYSLWKSAAGETTLMSAWIASPRINQGLGAENRIRVIARDSEYRFFINGAPAAVCVPNDADAASTFVGGECVGGRMRDAFHAASPATGKLGFIAQSTATGGGGVVVAFDNMLVFHPDEPGDGSARL